MTTYIEYIFGKQASIQRKVILVYLLVAVAPIVIITLVISAIYYNSILKSADGLIEQNAVQHEVVVKERMEAYEDVLYDLVSDKDYIELGKLLNSGDERSALVYIEQMERLLERSVYTHDKIRGITFLADAGRYASYSNGTAAPTRASGRTGQSGGRSTGKSMRSRGLHLLRW